MTIILIRYRGGIPIAYAASLCMIEVRLKRLQLYTLVGHALLYRAPGTLNFYWDLKKKNC